MSAKKLVREKWIKTGIPGFDELFDEGIPRGTNNMVSGGPGTGKTIFCLQMLYNLAREGHDCVYLSMEETPERLKSHMKKFGWPTEDLKREGESVFLKVGEGRFIIRMLEPILMARSVEALLEKASGRLKVDVSDLLNLIPPGVNPCAVAMDSISALETAFAGRAEHYRIYIEQLFKHFRQLGATSFLVTETVDAPVKFSKTGVEEFLSDGIIGFYYYKRMGHRRRGVEVVKLRGIGHSKRTVTIRIEKDGMRVFPDEPIEL